MPASRSITLPVALLLAGCITRVESRSVERVYSPAVDLQSRNLEPKAELDALLAGGVHGTLEAGVARIAVLPLEVRGGTDEDRERGTMIADVLSHQLAAADGVALLDRGQLSTLIDELGRARASSSESEAKLGSLVEPARLLGAEFVITGSVHIGDRGKTTAYLRVLSVHDGVIRSDSKIALTRVGWEPTIGKAVPEILRAVGVYDQVIIIEDPPLTGDELELASRARELFARGQLVDAQPLFAAALAQPSSAWDFEADYLELMDYLGMASWVAKRGEVVLARMPEEERTLCQRARVLQAMIPSDARGAQWVEPAREAVRVAASCGDPVVLGNALLDYADVTSVIHIPTSEEALARASALAEQAENAGGWLRCEVEARAYSARYDAGDVGGDPSANFVELADRCTEVGNLRVATIALGLAGDLAWSPSDRITFRERSVELGGQVGGYVLDDASLALARQLRAVGQLSRADEVLLATLGRHLQQIVALHGGALPAQEQRLDDDLLRAAGIERPPATTPLPQLEAHDAELSAVHRRALARALRAWAERTAADSLVQARFYVAVADEIDPPAPTPRIDPRDWRASLGALGVSPERIGDERPLLADAPDFLTVLGLLEETYNIQRAENLPFEQREPVVAAYRNLAEWSQSPRALRYGLWMEARLLADRGATKQALSTLEAAASMAKDDPNWSYFAGELQTELSRTADLAVFDQAIERRIEAGKRISPSAWLRALHLGGHERARRDPTTFTASVQRLLDAGNELIEREAWEDAALAAELAAELYSHGSQSLGTDQAVSLLITRVQLLERLGDPYRTAIALTDVLNEFYRWIEASVGAQHAAAFFVREPFVAELDAMVVAQLDKLAEAGRIRDALRVVARLPAETPSAVPMLEASFGWLTRLSDSAEAPQLEGELSLKASYVAVGEQRQQLLERAAAAFKTTGDVNGEGRVRVMQLNGVQGEQAFWDTWQACVAMPSPMIRMDCLGGLARAAQDPARLADDLRDRRRFAQALATIEPDAQRVFPNLTLLGAQQLLTDLAVVAVAARDGRRYEDYLRQLEASFADSPNPKRRAELLLRLIFVLISEEPGRALELAERIDAIPELPDGFRGQTYTLLARVARRAGATEREQDFLLRGEKAALAEYAIVAFRYPLYRGDLELSAGRLRPAKQQYEAAIASVEQHNAGSPDIELLRTRVALIEALQREHAEVLRDADAALANLRGRIAGGQPVDRCVQNQWGEIAASVELARANCEQGDRLRREAREAVQACGELSELLWSGTNACRQKVAGSFGG